MKKIKLFLFPFLKHIMVFGGKLRLHKIIPGSYILYDFLVRFLWPYQNIIEIQGSKMYVNILDKDRAMRQTFEGYASKKIHEEVTTNLFKNIVKEKNVVVDLGANIGYFTLLAARLIGENGKVFAFEPEPKNYNYLVKNIELNNYKQVNALQMAVSNKKGKTKLFICNYDTGHHTINKYEGVKAYSGGRPTKEKSIEIETTTLDEFFRGNENSVNVIKMDVEGAEVLALAGMDKILKTNKKLKMIIEFFPLLIKSMGSSPEEFIRKLLEDYKFSIYVIPDDYNALKGKMIKINKVEELMSICKGEKDHLNLFLKHDEENKVNS